jgi:hypothetical protein
MSDSREPARIVIVGLKRSGNHLLANWVRGLLDRPVYFNDIRTDGGPAALKDIASFFDSVGERDAIVSVEEPEKLGREHASSLDAKVLLLIRDPLNWYASAIFNAAWATGRDPVELHAELGGKLEVRYLATYRRWKDPVSRPVDYNRFVVSPAYRADLADHLGRPLTEEAEAALGVLWSFAPDGGSILGSGVVNASSFRADDAVPTSVLDRYRTLGPLGIVPPGSLIDAASEGWGITWDG